MIFRIYASLIRYSLLLLPKLLLLLLLCLRIWYIWFYFNIIWEQSCPLNHRRIWKGVEYWTICCISHCLYRQKLSNYPFEWLFDQHDYKFYDDQFEGYYHEFIKYMCIYFMKDIYLYRWNYPKQAKLKNNHVSKLEGF